MNDRTVCITGATGFLGRWVTEELIHSGRRVRALVRHGTEPVNLDGIDCEIVRGSLAGEDLDRAFEGCDEVVHLAALVSFDARDTERLEEVNVGGTRRVLEACERLGVRRLLHCSSVAAVGIAKDSVAIDEDAHYDLDRFGVAYLSTKRRAEELALGHQGATEVVVVNPAALFGPGDRRAEAYESLRRIRDKGLPVRPPGGLCTADVRDVARGHRLALERGVPGRRYILGGDNLSGDQLAEALCPPFDRPVPRIRLPHLAVSVVASMLRLIERVPFVPAPWPSGVLRLAGQTFRFSSERAQRELGYRCRPFSETIADVARELREER